MQPNSPMAIGQLRKERFVDGAAARRQSGEFGPVIIHADNFMTELRKTRRRDHAYVTAADNGDSPSTLAPSVWNNLELPRLKSALATVRIVPTPELANSSAVCRSELTRRSQTEEIPVKSQLPRSG